LHKLVRRGKGTEELVDRLMISSLIEARSCERFALLAEACEDKELKKLYGGLWASEHGHYRTFIQLAEQILPAGAVAKRWEEMLDGEARIIREQPAGPRMHSGVPDAR
jgi:tRNA-(ms[2]io[6]A)-hydroxylase